MKQIFLLDRDGAPEGTLGYETLFANPSAPFPQQIDLGQPATIIYTSGSTARPKGVLYTHHVIISGAKLGQPGIGRDGIIVQASSVMHSGGFSNLITSVHGGASLVRQAFDADQVLDAIERHCGSYFSGLPFMFLALFTQVGAV